MKNMVKRFIRKADKLLFNGWLIDQYQKIRNKNRMFFHKNKCVVINEPVADLVIMQYSQMENEFNEYQFYDLAVRYLAIGQYYGKNKEGYRLYKMMHSKGGNYGNRNESEDYYQKQRMRKRVPRYGVKVEEHSIEQYEALIKSYESEGYKEDSVLMADRNLLNMNGSHRIALSVYFEREFVNVEIHNLLSKRRYNKEFFWSNGFDFNEIALIENTQNLIFQKCRKAIGDFYCILFPPAVNYFDDIVKDMERMDPDNIRVSGWEDIHCSVYEFVGYIKMLYSFDSISQENFERKLQYILNASVIHNGQVTYRKVRLEIHNPKYRLKSDNGLPESVVTVRLKEAIRNRYKVKEERFNRRYAGDYDHDVIIHSTDNYLSNNAFRIIDGINRNISGIIDILNGYEYAILESSIDKIPLEFPLDFYLCDDIDILINEDDMEKLAEKLMEYCKRTFHVRWVRFEKTKSIFGMRVKVLIRDSLLLMFDLMKKIPNIKEECTSELLKRRRNINRYYGLSFNDELVVRLAKFMDDQQKLHHLRFIQDSKDDFIFEPELFIRPKEALSVYKEIILKENVPGGGV